MNGHKLKIISLFDAQADCSCGWHFVYTGERTRQEIKHEYTKHLPKENKTMNTQKETCKDRVSKEYADRMKDLQKLFKAYQDGNEEKYADDLGTFPEYGLCFDYVPQGTFNDQTEAFFRYQLSTGGPGDEFRFFVNPDFSVHRIEYWFLDWFDGAHKVLKGKSYTFMEEIFDFFKEIGTVQAEFDKAKE